jgi:hypothetical protein
MVLVQGALKLLASHFRYWCHVSSFGKRHPEPGVRLAGIPGFDDGLKPAHASSIGLFPRLVRVEEGAAIGSHGVDGTPTFIGEEDAGSIIAASRDQSEDARRLPTKKDHGTERGQQVLKHPVVQVLVRCVVLMNPFEVSRDQIAWDVVTVERAFVASADRPGIAKLGARRIDQGQGLLGHDELLEGNGRESRQDVLTEG